MKAITIPLALFFCVSLAFGQQSYIDSINHQTFLQTGNTTDLYYECLDSCQTVVMNFSEAYMSKFRLKTTKARNEYALTMLNQYGYLFKSRGFNKFVVNVAGVPSVKKHL